jgi:hypothetical protein
MAGTAASVFTLEAERGRWIEEAIAHHPDEERFGDVGEHRADACGVGDVAGQRGELIDGVLQFAGVAIARDEVRRPPFPRQ